MQINCYLRLADWYNIVMQRFDYSTLVGPVSLSDRLKAQPKSEAVGSIVVAVVLLVFAVVLSVGRTPSVVLLWLGFATIFLIVIAANTYASYGRIVRLQRFSEANGLTFRSNVDYDGRPGLIFNQGHSKKFLGILSAGQGNSWEIGNYRYVTGSGKNRSTHDYGFVRIQLPRRLPNMLLDAKQNNFLGSWMSNLPSSLAGGQKLSLEGDFDKYFTLYAPAEYKRDALYVFTPDVMQALIDSVHDYDCEVIDDSFYVYSSNRLKIDSQQQLEEIIAVIDKLKPELIDQTDYYADERVADRSLNVVAQSGARLKTSTPKWVIVVVLIWLIHFGWIFWNVIAQG